MTISATRAQNAIANHMRGVLAGSEPYAVIARDGENSTRWAAECQHMEPIGSRKGAQGADARTSHTGVFLDKSFSCNGLNASGTQSISR